MSKTKDEMIATQLKYIPPHDILDRVQAVARKRFEQTDDKGFMLTTLGLKTVFDLLDKLVYDDGFNELAGALEVVTLLCSVDNMRYYDLLKDPKYADVLAIIAGVNHATK